MGGVVVSLLLVCLGAMCSADSVSDALEESALALCELDEEKKTGLPLLQCLLDNVPQEAKEILNKYKGSKELLKTICGSPPKFPPEIQDLLKKGKLEGHIQNCVKSIGLEKHG
ncbi:hypothetical protein V5799_009087 [Amblyomma americanum]|uniref:Secreted protein n=1 Tax=Amblyomma americanum TaxID=6943 RepID=A0AAQ4FD80_AMBAM